MSSRLLRCSFLHLSRLLLLALLVWAGQGGAKAGTLPANFFETVINGPAGSTWNEAVGMVFEENGRMYVWERTGKIWFKEYGGSTWTLLLDISPEVGYWRDFGLLGFALDPNFRSNGNIYLSYVVDRHYLMNFGTTNYNASANQYFSATIGRITRYTARASDGFSSVDLASRQILLGETRSNGPAILFESHGVGSLVFGTDGTLLASFGDGASYNSTDVGNAGETYYAQGLADGIIKTKENVGAYRSQLVDCLAGKVVRIDPVTGDGIPSNPFYDPANPHSARSRVWALGLRNPCRMTLRPGTGSHNRADGNPGVLYIGDVGYITWEDLNVCTGPGQNFGWPAFEGIDVHSAYYNATVPNRDAPNPLFPAGGCSQFFSFNDLIKQKTTAVANQPPFNNPCNTSQKIPSTIPQFLHTPPAIDWQHGNNVSRSYVTNGSGVATAVNIGAVGSPVTGNVFQGNCSIGGVWCVSNGFPAQYSNTYFQADFGVGWIKNFVFDTNNNPVAVRDFLSGGGGIVFMATHPIDGGLFYLAYAADEVTSTLRKISYQPSGNLPPTAVASANTNYGPGPLTVQLTGSASIDPESLPLRYRWNFGDGTPDSTNANPLHVFNAPPSIPTSYTVSLMVTDNVAQVSSTTLLISVNNTPPQVAINSPVNGTLYSMSAASNYVLSATVTDNESSDAQLQYRWVTILHHNNHEHGGPPDTNHVATSTITPVGCDGNTYYYRIVLTVTDPAGLSTQAESDLFPNCPEQDLLAISTTTLPGGALNAAYAASLVASGGTLPYTWSIASGSLPPGVSLNATSGAIAGTPTAGGTFNFTAQVNDSAVPAQTATRALSINVSTPPPPSTLIGNTNNGALTDAIGASWINAGRFQANGGMTVTTMFAKIAAVTGRYKCAIYSDSGGVPSRLLRNTAELTNPNTGWQSFALTSSLQLTNGQFYWLAIWSDNANAQIYYSDTAGSIRWGNVAYGTWPDPWNTAAGSSVNYCIYATGAATTLTSIAVTPANPSIASGATQQFTATGTYSDGSTQNITSQVVWTSSVPSVATISASGLATGAATGNSTITATLNAISGNTTLNVQPPALAITTATLPNATVSTAYTATLAASGGTAPYFWSITNGALPSGLVLNTNTGAISGTPTAVGTSNFTARVRDSSNPIQIATRALSISVTTTLISIAVTPANPSIVSGTTQQFTATGTYSDGSTQNITSQVVWNSSLPAVAGINASGLASGASVGNTTISATLSSVSGNTILTVLPPPVNITTATLPGGMVNAPYTATLAANGGTAPYFWSITNGALPSGLVLNTNTGAISGSPTASGTSNFTARVRDSGNPIQTATRALSISIASAPTTVGNTNDGALTDSIGAGWINAGRFQATANLTAINLVAKLGAITGHYKAAIYSDSGALPSRVLRTTAELTNVGSGWQTFALTSPLVLTNGQFYWLAIWSDSASATVFYSNTAGTIRWDPFTYGTWPDPITTTGGASVNYCIYASGTAATLNSITVTPANPSIAFNGTQPFTATGTYSDGSSQNLTTQVVWNSATPAVATINSNGLATAVSAGDTIVSATLGSVSGNTILTVRPPPVTITTATLPNGVIGSAYSATLAASGGTTPYTWTIISGALPSGLLLNTNSGAITGTPGTAGTSNFTARVTDASNPVQTTNRALSITVTATLTAISLAPTNAVIGSGATQQFTATGTYSDGSTLNITSQVGWNSSATGVATINAAGLASAVAAGTTTIRASLSGITNTTSLTVLPPPVIISTTTLPAGTAGSAYAATLAATGGTSPYRWSIISGAIPNGLTLNTNTGGISGTPATNGIFNFTAQVNDSGNPVQSTNKALSIVINIAPSGNPIVLENAKPGNPPSQWEVTGDGDASIQGFATQMSVNKGQLVQFKVKTTATNYRLDIYRLGYYAGNGARFITNISPSVALPQTQPNPITDTATGLVDCGNWAVSASWQVPSTAVSGVYIARLVRTDTSGASHIVFVVRDDASTSAILYQTSDTEWQAYNSFGGNSLYVGAPAGRAYKVSYNRPLVNRALAFWTGLFTAEIPMIRWLEANGYDVSYSTGIETDRSGSRLLQHRVFLSVGHDEYWSATQRTNVEAARSAGVHLAFFSGNEMFWKVRWEPSIDGSGTAHRTIACYKETHANAKIDPNAAWTGTWRDPRFTPPSDGGRPENALSGTLFAVNGITLNALEVPAAYGTHRFWRNTTVANQAPGQIASFGAGILGFEWDIAPDNGFAPPGQGKLSLTTVNGLSVLQDYGSTYATGQATHSLSLYRHSSGALVFGAGTVQWSWGLDNTHDHGTAIADNRLRQATVNLLADMGAQPGSLQSGLVPGVQSADTTPSVSVITSPTGGATLPPGAPVTITGTASDVGGIVWGVEVSTDNGATWHAAAGKGNWTYAWTPLASGTVTIKSRAFDDSANLETPSAGVTVNVVGNQNIVGNTAEGASSDGIGAGWINAGRFQATANVTAVNMFAKISAITGRYKCAIYTDNGSQPNRLLRASSEVINPGTGWQSFPLTSSVVLTNGQFYWLAIWSDNNNAQIFYSGTSGSIRWGAYNYGTWPDPIATSGGASVNYCIYASSGAAPASLLSLGAAGAETASTEEAFIDRSFNAPPAQPTILSIETEKGAVIITSTAIPGRTYILESVENPDDANWTPISEPVSANGSMIMFIDTTAGTATRYYRILQLLQQE